MKRLILQMVAVEGPVYQDVVLRRLREAWGIKRSGQNIKDNFASAVRELGMRSEIAMRGEFLYPKDKKEIAVRIPQDGIDDSRRGPLQIAKEVKPGAYEFG